MARPIKEGFDYFSLDVDFLHDRKVAELGGKYGNDGRMLFITLLARIYDEHGYYMEYDEGLIYVLSNDLNISPEKTGQILNFLLTRSLLNEHLFNGDKILTSRGIQKRFQQMAKSKRRTVEVNENFWILKNCETESFIKVAHFEDKYSKNPDKYSKNHSKYSKNPLNKNKSKNKSKSKIKEYIGTDEPSAHARFIKPTPKEISAYCQERQNSIDPSKFFDYYEANGWMVGKNPMKDWKAAIRSWEKNGYDVKPQKTKAAAYEQRHYTDEELEQAFNKTERSESK
jgi:hypothetical protein